MDKVLLFIEVLIGAFSQMWLALLCLIGIIIGLFIAFGIPFFLIWHLAEYMLQKPDEEYRDLPKLEFKQFYDFYSLSPNTWVIEEDYVIKLEDKDYEESVREIGDSAKTMMEIQDRIVGG